MASRTQAQEDYRFGFNGKEMDNEVYGNGNIYDYGFRIYNPALGKFLSVDPLSPKFPFYTPYQFAGNKPIWAIDLDGCEDEIYQKRLYENLGFHAAMYLLNCTGIRNEFKAAVAANNIDVYYFTYDSKSAIDIPGKGGGRKEVDSFSYDEIGYLAPKNIYGGTEAGFTKLINSYSEAEGLRKKDHDWWYLDLDDIASSFAKGRKVLCIGLADQLFEPFENVSFSLNHGWTPEHLKNLIVNAAEVINHEESVHGENDLNGKEISMYKEHEEYSSVNDGYSPTTRQFLFDKTYIGSRGAKETRILQNKADQILKDSQNGIFKIDENYKLK